MSWTRFLTSAAPAEHGVQVYDESDELARAVCAFLDAGLRTGSPAVVIATPDHRARFAHELERSGWRPSELEEEGRLILRDAEETLATIMDGDAPSGERFDRVIGSLVDGMLAAFPGKTPRAFGEMVDVLWQRGRTDAALALEELWN